MYRRPEENSVIIDSMLATNINLLGILDRSGYFERINKGFERILGGKAKDYQDKSFLEFIHPDDYETTEYVFSNLLVEDQLLHFNNRFHCQDDSYANIAWCVCPAGSNLILAGNEIAKEQLPEVTAKEKGQMSKSCCVDAVSEIIGAVERLTARQQTNQEVRKIRQAAQFLKNRLDMMEQDSAEERPSECPDWSSADFDDQSAEEKKHILITDDSIFNRKLLESALKDDYRLSFVDCGEEALLIANQADQPDLILLDIIMPGMSGYKVCEELQKNSDTRDIPVLFLTALNEAADEELGLSMGAMDYIKKPFSMPVVKTKIKNYLALKSYQKMLKTDSYRDMLTKIANRRHFDEMFDVEIRKSKRYRKPLSMLLIDIDHFKNYNDTYGHLAGDECLKQVAATLKFTLKRSGDFVARWGGEEFACLLPDTDESGGAEVAERLRAVIFARQIPHKSSPVADVVTVSIGAVTFTDQEMQTADGLLKLADVALYEAKEKGRNRVCFKY